MWVIEEKDWMNSDFSNLDLRRDTYEDYTFPLESVSNDTNHLHGFDLFSLRNYAKHYGKINSFFLK